MSVLALKQISIETSQLCCKLRKRRVYLTTCHSKQFPARTEGTNFQETSNSHELNLFTKTLNSLL